MPARWDPIWHWRIRPVRVLFILLVLGSVAYFLMPVLLDAYARWLIRTDSPVHADIAIVLGGGEGERLGAAVRVWREGRVPALLIIDPGIPLLPVYAGEDSLTMGEVKRRIAVRRGMPEETVMVLKGPTSTYEEAVASRPYLEARQIKSAIVVTSPFHSRRARATFRHLFRGSPVRITLETLPLSVSQDRPSRWWVREHDQMAVFTETVKILFYWNRYGISPV
jgi:uncharacterized SAM-binding protein YcdF (DUF218 family)